MRCALIHRVCCLAGSADLLQQIRNRNGGPALRSAIRRHDTAVLYDYLIDAVSYQGDRRPGGLRVHRAARPGDVVRSRALFGPFPELSEAAQLLAFPRLPLRQDQPHLCASRATSTDAHCLATICATAASTRPPIRSTCSSAILRTAIWSAGSITG